MVDRIDRMVVSLGAATRMSFETLGSIGILFWQVLTGRPKFHTLVEQMVVLGVSSLPIVLLASMFTGFIATWMVKYLAGDFVGPQYLGMMVLKVVLVELGPTLIGLILAGRIGAKLAAEVGTMKVTEQIDALKCLSLDPIRYIIAPRVLAGFVMQPVLFVFGSVAAIVSSQLLASLALGLPPTTFYNSMHIMFQMSGVYMGLIKSFAFGGIINLCGCYFGINTTGGAVGVGASTRKAVVSSSILILIANLMISQLMI